MKSPARDSLDPVLMRRLAQQFGCDACALLEKLLVE
jgi:hypothetical protein